jgi:hypothetical protein
VAGYRGYLNAHLERIEELARQGATAPEIAKVLYQEGVRPPQKQMGQLSHKDSIRSLAAAVRHALGRRGPTSVL